VMLPGMGDFAEDFEHHGLVEALARSALPVNAVAARLPAGNVRAVPGGHDWTTWRRLWDGYLAKWSREA
jgi:hypothetical protein